MKSAMRRFCILSFLKHFGLRVRFPLLKYFLTIGNRSHLQKYESVFVDCSSEANGTRELNILLMPFMLNLLSHCFFFGKKKMLEIKITIKLLDSTPINSSFLDFIYYFQCKLFYLGVSVTKNCHSYMLQCV